MGFRLAGFRIGLKHRDAGENSYAASKQKVGHEIRLMKLENHQKLSRKPQPQVQKSVTGRGQQQTKRLQASAQVSVALGALTTVQTVCQEKQMLAAAFAKKQQVYQQKVIKSGRKENTQVFHNERRLAAMKQSWEDKRRAQQVNEHREKHWKNDQEKLQLRRARCMKLKT